MNSKQFLQAFIDRVWSNGEVDAVDEFLAPTYTIHRDPGDPWDGQTLDIAGFKERLVKSRAAAPDQRFTVEQMIEEGDRIAVAWTWQGTHLGCVPATGRAITMTGMTIYAFEAGRLAGHWQIADRLSVYRQITA